MKACGLCSLTERTMLYTNVPHLEAKFTCLLLFMGILQKQKKVFLIAVFMLMLFYFIVCSPKYPTKTNL